MSRVAVVGAGLAGLASARALVAGGADVTVYEAAEAVGGRVRTDVVDGFQIDRGFQVLLTAYPEARRVLDYRALRLRAFEPGARVWTGGRFQSIGDPLRRPSQLVPTLRADVGSLADKVRVLRLRQSVLGPTDEALWERPEMTTEQALRQRYGFSERMVDRFFRPFLGGVLLDRSLGASSRAFEVYFRRFSQGQAAVPAGGIRAVPEQLAAGLPPGTVRLGTPVDQAESDAVRVGGERAPFDAVVVATDADRAQPWTGIPAPEWKGTVQLAWAAPAPPTRDPVLMLDGDGAGPCNNVQVMSAVAPEYAPPGQALVTASVLGDPDPDDAALDRSARRQLRAWFGDGVDAWRLVRATRVPRALPDLPSLEPPERPVRHRGLYLAGDWRRNASVNGALVSGRHAAEAVLADLA